MNQECYLLKARPPTAAQLAAGNYPKRKLSYRGLTITVENEPGSVRRGKDRNGQSWETKMANAYGYVNGSMGVDGDHVDCFIGPDDGAAMVYVVHQRKAGNWRAYDEDKAMIGFASEAEAVAAFKRHYNDARFLGPVTALPFDEFKTKVLATKEKPSMIKSTVLFFKSLVAPHTRRLKSGKVVQVQSFENNRTRKTELTSEEKFRQGSLFDELSSRAVSVTARPGKAVPAILKPSAGAALFADLAAKFKQFGDGFELRNKDGKRWAVLMPDATNEGKYRYQVFGDSGLKEHYSFDGAEAALRGAVDAGFVEPDAGAMDRLAPVWAAKFADEEVQASKSKHGDRTKDAALDEAISHLKEDAQQGDMPAHERKEDAELVEKLEAARRDDGEAGLRAMWNEKGVPKARQDELIAQIADKAKPGAQVGPFKVAGEGPARVRKYYVTMRRDGEPRTGWLAGPFDNHDDALSRVEEARKHAYDLDPRSAFDSFGTASYETEEGKHHAGVLNDRMGVGKKAAPYVPVMPDDHPAPVPKMALSGLSEEDRAKWIDLHRQQHEAQYKDLAKTKKDLERARGKRNKAESDYNEAANEYGKAVEARQKGQPGGERAEEFAAWANRANDEYRKHRENVDRLSNVHAALVERIAGLGKAKEKLVPGSGDLRMDFAAMKLRSDADEAEHAKWAAGQYKGVKPAGVPKVAAVSRVKVKVGDIKALIDGLNWTRNDLSGHTAEEFRRADVPARFREGLDKLKEIMDVVPERYKERAASAVEHAEKTISRWREKQAEAPAAELGRSDAHGVLVHDLGLTHEQARDAVERIKPAAVREVHTGLPGAAPISVPSYSRSDLTAEAERVKRGAKVVSIKPAMGRHQSVGNALRTISAEYHHAIPIGKILDAARSQGFEPLQEDGTPWEGMLTGADGRTSIDLKGSKKALHVQWHKMPSGKYEVNAYML